MDPACWLGRLAQTLGVENRLDCIGVGFGRQQQFQRFFWLHVNIDWLVIALKGITWHRPMILGFLGRRSVQYVGTVGGYHGKFTSEIWHISAHVNVLH